jgi:hypothetical protein
MGCFGGDEVTPGKETKDWDLSLQERKRSCTDGLCMLLLIAVWVIMTAVGLVALGAIESDSLKAGKIERLISPIDYDGRICGLSDAVKDKPNAYYMLSGAAICVEECPSTTDYNTFICEDASVTLDATQGWTYIQSYKCLFEIKSSPIANRCILDLDSIDNAALTNAATAGGASAMVPILTADPFGGASAADSGWFAALMGDVYNNQGVIFGFGLGVSIVVAFLYIYILRIPGVLDTIIWGIIGLIFVVLLAGFLMLFLLAQDYQDNKEELDKTDADILTVQICSYIVLAFAFIYLCIIFFLRKQIRLAIGVVKEAGHALNDMPLLILLPVFQAIGFIIFLVPWIIYTLFLASSGDMTTTSEDFDNGSGTPVQVQYNSFEYNEATTYAFLYMIFAFFWSSQFIIAMGQIIIAMSVSVWYFTKGKARENLGNGTFFWAFKNSIYHSGTAAFGSLVIAIVKTIRFIINYIQRKAKQSKNAILEKIMCIIDCCMWCFEKMLKFLNTNAYIQTAIHGYPFCKAAKSAFALILRNIARIFAVKKVGDFVLFIGKLFIPLVTTFLAYLVLSYGSDEDDSNSLIMPCIVTFIIAYFVALMFVELFGMAISTVILCYVADEEMFPDNPEKRFVPGSLKNTLTATQRQALEAGQVAPDGGEVGKEPEDQPMSPDVKTKPAAATPVSGKEVEELM